MLLWSCVACSWSYKLISCPDRAGVVTRTAHITASLVCYCYYCLLLSVTACCCLLHIAASGLLLSVLMTHYSPHFFHAICANFITAPISIEWRHHTPIYVTVTTADPQRTPRQSAPLPRRPFGDPTSCRLVSMAPFISSRFSPPHRFFDGYKCRFFDGYKHLSASLL